MFKFFARPHPEKEALTCWFQKRSVCSYTGLPVYSPESYVSRHPEANYRIAMARLGERILLVKSSGYVRSHEMDEELAFTDSYISRHFQADAGFVLIEDYTDVGGSDSEARRKYIEFYRKLHDEGRLVGAILYNLSTLFKISFKVAKRLQIHDENAFAADTYEQAVDIAHKLIQKHDLKADRKDLHHLPVRDIDINDSHEKALAGSVSRFQKISSWIKNFRLNRYIRINEKQIEDFSQSLLNYIHSIDWHKDGFEPFDSSGYANQTARNVFDAISFVKSEIDTLMRERNETERILRISEKRYRRIVELASAGILEFDFATRRFISVNEYIQVITGYSTKELLSMDPTDLLRDDSKHDFACHLDLIMSGRNLPEKIVYQIITREGEIKWVLLHVHITYENHQPQKANVVLSDITHIKQAENRLLDYQWRLKKLSIQLSMSEENQRRELASQLHDRISQELFGVYLQLNTLENNLKSTEHAEKVHQVKLQQFDIIKDARALTFDLSPPVLYDLGLLEAVKSLAETVSTKYGLIVKTQFSGDLDHISEEIKIILFRNIKELLHNIVKYARAECARIDIYRRENGLCVEVSDDGIGFEVKHTICGTQYGSGYGLFDIKEKMNHLGGSVKINSSVSEGTVVRMHVPTESLAVTEM